MTSESQKINRPNNGRYSASWLLLAVVLVCGVSRQGYAQRVPKPNEGNVFAEAISVAQKRCVKIFGAGIGREPGYATGMIISADGKILTARGIYLSGDNIRVVLADGSMHYADVVRHSPLLQTAILKIDAETPEFFEVTKTCPAHQGDWVLAVTNLFKVADGSEALSINLGIVSLRTRLDAKYGTQDVSYHGDILLVDAITSNPGAPGGALVKSDGTLAGMIGKIIESKSTGTRLNYAIPVDILYGFVQGKDFTPKVAQSKPKKKGALGIRVFTLGGKRAPAYIDRVLPNSPADKAGLRKDDLIISVAGQVIRNVLHFQKIAAELTADKEIIILVKRKQLILAVRLKPTSARDKPK